jgi:hypothetical protein
MLRRDFCLPLPAAGAAAAARTRLTRANLCFITDEVSRSLRTALQLASECRIRQVELCTVCGDGDTPYLDIFRALGRAGYAGALSMETHFRIGGSREPASRRSMEGLLPVLARV